MNDQPYFPYFKFRFTIAIHQGLRIDRIACPSEVTVPINRVCEKTQPEKRGALTEAIIRDFASLFLPETLHQTDGDLKPLG